MHKIFWALLPAWLILHTAKGQPGRIPVKVDPVFTKVITEILADPKAQPFAFATKSAQPIFFPEDIQKQFDQANYYLHFSRLGGKLVANPDGTGRLYDFQPEGNQLMVERLDHSIYTGYNFSAYAFTFRDTLFSLGGFGFWKYNGLLRHYDPVTGGWEISPTNMEFPISGNPDYRALWIDQVKGYLYYVTRSVPQPWHKGHAYPRDLFQDTSRVFRLDLTKKDWQELGRVTTEGLHRINNTGKIAELPFGELLITEEAGARKLMLLDYDRNLMFQLKDSVARPITKQIFTSTANKFTWYSKGQLFIGPSRPDTVFHVPLGMESFIPLPGTIYATEDPSYQFSMDHLWMMLCLFAGITIGAGTIRAFGKKVTVPGEPGPVLSAPVENFFNPFELNILRAFLKEKNTLLPEEVNVLLETDRRSVEIQKKYRSETIRGINEKCSKLLGTDQRLVIQERLADDRRQFIYRIEPATFKALRERTTGW